MSTMVICSMLPSGEIPVFTSWYLFPLFFKKGFIIWSHPYAGKPLPRVPLAYKTAKSGCLSIVSQQAEDALIKEWEKEEKYNHTNKEVLK